jgi:aspartate dehydrogenase
MLQLFQLISINFFISQKSKTGVDAIVSASAGRIDEVRLTTTKNPRSLKGSRDYLAGKGIDIDNLAERTVIFDGTAREAVKAFPKNINVAATISIAGIGFERTSITVIADPEAERTERHIEVRGEAGTVKTMVRNIPDEKNPGTSHLAVLSAIATMRNAGDGVWVV